MNTPDPTSATVPAPPRTAPFTADSLFPPEGPQTIGQVLDTGFRVFKISLVRCLLFGAVAMIAGQLPNIYSLAMGEPFGAYLHGDPVTVALAVAGSVLAVYFSAVMLLRQRDVAQGGRRSTRAELAHGLRRLPALIGVTAVAVFMLGIVPLLLFLSQAGAFPALSRAVVDIVAAALALPVVWALPGLAMAVAVAVLTPSGMLASLKQGLSLALGNWWRTMITFVVWGVLLAVLNLVAVVVLMMALPLLGAEDVITLSAITPVVFIALRAIGLPFLVAILLAVYGELLVRKQGVDLVRRVASVAQA
ncbi:MAG: hypothetical protein WDO56_32565 [Gammaproteobacteria bacterium]